MAGGRSHGDGPRPKTADLGRLVGDGCPGNRRDPASVVFFDKRDGGTKRPQRFIGWLSAVGDGNERHLGFALDQSPDHPWIGFIPRVNQLPAERVNRQVEAWPAEPDPSWTVDECIDGECVSWPKD